MRYYIFITLLLKCFTLSSQNCPDIDNIGHYRVLNYFWTDSILENQTKNHSNESIWYKHKVIDGKIIYEEYFEESGIKFSLEIIKQYDTLISGQYDEYGDLMSADTSIGFFSIPHGNYKEYKLIHGKPHLVTVGEFENGKRIGTWWTKNSFVGHIREVIYDSKETVNFYKKYYGSISSNKNDWNIKTQGQFQMIRKTNKDGVPISNLLQTGTWYYYDETGKLETTVIYKHEK